MFEKYSYLMRFFTNPLKFAGIAITFFVLLTSNCFGQSISWQWTYDGPYVVDYGYEILPAPNNEFYLAGYLSNINDYAYVLKLNQFGDTIWSKTILAGNNGRVYSATNSSDGGCVFAIEMSDSSLLVKLDPDGNVIWSKGSNVSATIWEIKLVSDGGFIACGNQSLVGYVAKYNSTGDMVWHRQYSGGSAKSFQSVLEKTGEGYILTGDIDLRPVVDSGKALLTKLDYTGNIITEKYFGADKLSIGIKITETGNDLLIGGNCFLNTNDNKIFILKINENLELLQTKVLPHSASTDEFFDDFVVVNTNRYIICNRLDTNQPVFQTHAKVRILDSNLNITHQWLSPSYGYSSFTSVIPLINGDLIFGGTFEYGTVWVERGFDYYAARTDSNLNLPPLPPISINSNSNEIPITSTIYQNYPNPFNPVTNIKYEIPKDVNVNFKIYDILGREVFSMNEYKKAGSYEVQFDGTNCASGMYFYKLETDGFSDTKKMVLIK
ncbi:MAG: T9SS type A sorting domain-containing protein [Ignavibacteria bacterium]|nr:T9SS type A sorting domain-containing protein [Ignavibacteria bacterium]